MDECLERFNEWMHAWENYTEFLNFTEWKLGG